MTSVIYFIIGCCSIGILGIGMTNEYRRGVGCFVGIGCRYKVFDTMFRQRQASEQTQKTETNTQRDFLLSS